MKRCDRRQLELAHALATARSCPECGAAIGQPCLPTPAGVTCAARRTIDLAERVLTMPERKAECFAVRRAR